MNKFVFKNIFCLLIILFIDNSNALCQKRGFDTNRLGFAYTAGLSLGQETIIGLPKFGGLASYNLSNNKYKRFGGFYKSSIYFGSEVSLFAIVAGAWSISGIAGINLNRFTFESSITRLGISSPDGNVKERETNLNLKLGVILGPVWIRVGPSYFHNESIWQTNFDDFLSINGTYMNIDVTVNMDIEK